jgi:hypothetical protein
VLLAFLVILESQSLHVELLLYTSVSGNNLDARQQGESYFASNGLPYSLAFARYWVAVQAATKHRAKRCKMMVEH